MDTMAYDPDELVDEISEYQEEAKKPVVGSKKLEFDPDEIETVEESLEGDYVDVLGVGEAAAKNLAIGISDFVNILLPEEDEIDLSDWKKEIEDTMSVSPSMVETLLIGMPKYIPDIFVATRAIKAINSTAKGAELISKHKDNIVAWMGAGELENAVSSAVHDEEYIAGLGAAGAGIVKTGVNVYKSTKGNLVEQEFKHLNPEEFGVRKQTTSDVPFDPDDIAGESYNLERVMKIKETIPEQKLSTQAAEDLTTDATKEVEYKQMLDDLEFSTEVTIDTITSSKSMDKYRSILDNIYDSIKDTKIYVSDVDSKFRGNTLGYYDRNTNSIMLGKDLNADTTMHELLHAAIERQIISNSDLMADANSIFNKAKKTIKLEGQWSKNEHEFISEVFTNKELNKAVRDNRTIREKIVNFINKILGRETKDSKMFTEIEELLFRGTKKEVDINKVASFGSGVREASESSTKKAIEKHGILYLGAKELDRRLSDVGFYKTAKDAITESDLFKKTAFNVGATSAKFKDSIEDILNRNMHVERVINKTEKGYTEQIQNTLKGFSKQDDINLKKTIVDSDLSKALDGKFGSTVTKVLDNNLKGLDDAINELSEGVSNDGIKAINKLSNFMYKKEATTDMLFNSAQIAKKHGIDQDKVDALLSLKTIGKNDTSSLVKLYKDRDKFDKIMTLQRANVNNSKKIFKDEEHRIMQGYSRETYGKNKQEFVVVSGQEKNKLLADEKAEWKVDKKLGGGKVRLVRRDLSEEFRHGVIPVQKKTFSGELMLSTQEASKLTEKELKNIAKLHGKNSHLAPIYDKDMKVVNYRFMMDTPDRVRVLDLDERLSVVIPKTASSIIRKEYSSDIQSVARKQFVTDAMETGSIDLKDPSSAFITKTRDGVQNIESLPANIRKEYRPLSERELKILPDSFKDVGFVRKDVSDVLLGYHEFFLSPESNRKARYLEKIYKGLIQEFKKNVVIKYPVVLMNNLLSNEAILLMHMSRPSDAAKLISYQNEALKELTKFRTLEKKRIMLQAAVDSGDKSKARRLSNIKKQMSLNKMVRAEQKGFIQSITDEVFLEGMATDNLFSSEMEKLYKKMYNADKVKPMKEFNEKLKDSGYDLRKGIKNLYMTEDSTWFSTMAGLMQKSDYMSRWAMYRYAKKGLGKSDKEARDMAIEMFIDYRKNLPKEIQALSEYGIIPFATFFFRSHVAMAKIANNNPSKVALSVVLSNAIDNEGDGVRTDSWNIFNSLFDTNAINPAIMSKHVVEPAYIDAVTDSLTDPTSLTRLAGFTIQ